MQKLLFGMIALIGLASPALSADWNWTACYVGGGIGGVWGGSEKWVVKTPGAPHSGESLGGHDVSGWIGGVQSGCDYQFESVVIGIQGDYGWTGAEGRYPSAQETGVVYDSDVKGLSSVTGRMGYAWNHFLGYVKGGIAWERVGCIASIIPAGTEITALTASVTRQGWTIGVGGEYAISEFLSGFIEYDYYDFGSSDVRFVPRLDGVPPGIVEIDETANVVRAGLNIRFGG